jgi:WXXGXW repeat (2 copies)
MSVGRYLKYILIVAIALAIPAKSFGQISVGISVHIGPPVLPVYVQPPCPSAGYIWTPGYWAYGPDGYYWVPGTWVMAPQPGYLWTPGYWGWGGGVYLWHGGYWGPHVGFYGGVNYGFGYGGVGFEGGYWNHGVFAYNRSVTNVNTTVINNTYNKTVVVNNTTVNNVSYNGGTGGTTAQPSAAEQAAAHEQHIQPTSEQAQHEHTASTNHAMLASVNGGRPSIAATPKAGVFEGKGVVAAKTAGTSNRPAANTAMKTDRPPAAQGSGYKGNSNGGTKTANSSTANANRPPNSGSNNSANKPASSSQSNASHAQNSNHSQNSNKPPKSTPHPEQPHHESVPKGEGRPGK